MCSTGAKGSTQTNKKVQVRVQKKGAKRNRRAPWSGTPDCPVCHRIVSGAPPDSVRCTRGERLQTLHLWVSEAALRYNSPDCPVYHKTVQCARGAMVGQRNGRLQWSPAQATVHRQFAEVRAAARRRTGQ
jgi:hypothetical protein